MLTIIVGRKKEKILTADGSVMSTYPALVRTDERLHYLQDLIRRGELGEVEVVLQRRWRKPCKLNLSPRLQKGIVEFLNRHHVQADMFFDCYAFTNLVYGVRPHIFPDMPRYWKVVLARSNPVPEETVFLLHRDEEGFLFRHAAICIASDLYISVYGAAGHLEFATLRDMKREFGANEVLRAIPCSEGGN